MYWLCSTSVQCLSVQAILAPVSQCITVVFTSLKSEVCNQSRRFLLEHPLKSLWRTSLVPSSKYKMAALCINSMKVVLSTSVLCLSLLITCTHNTIQLCKMCFLNYQWLFLAKTGFLTSRSGTLQNLWCHSQPHLQNSEEQPMELLQQQF